MRFAILLVALVGCISDDIVETSFGSVPGTPAIRFSRATTGLTNYGGVGFYKWNIIFSTTDGCGGDAAATFEINTALTGPNGFPTGAIPIRAEQVPTVVPSALATFDVATGVSGTVTIESIDGTKINGSVDATMTTGPMTGRFIAFTCQ